MTTTYFSTSSCKSTTVDITASPAADLLDYYQSCLDRSDSVGAFPGSAAWRKCKPHADALQALIAARPDVAALRKSNADAARAARMSSTYQD